MRAQEEGRADWRWVGRDFPRISRKSMANLWEIIVAYFCALIEDREDFKDFKSFKEVSASRWEDFKKVSKILQRSRFYAIL